MNEQTQAIIDRARALLAAAGDKWDDVGVAGLPSGYWAAANARDVYETAHADATLISAAPELLAALCDALEAAERRAAEAEAKVARMKARTAKLCDCTPSPHGNGGGDEGCTVCHGEGAVIVDPEP